MFENVPFDQTLKDLIDNEDWFGLGEYFAEKLNTITDAADRWLEEKFRPWALYWANAVGEIINGFVAAYHWERLGETVAHGMMAIVDAMYTFYTTVDWLAVGDALGRAVKAWFETMDWEGVSNYFASKMNAAIETAKGFVLAAMRNGTEFGREVAAAIQNWFEKVKWNDIATALIHGFNWAVNALVAWVGSTEMWDAIERMFEQFARAINGMDVEGMANSLGNAFVRALDTMRESGFISSAGEAFGRFLSALPWGDMFRAALEAAWAGLKGAFVGLFEGGHGVELAGLLAGALALKLGIALATEFAGMAFKLKIAGALTGGIKGGVELGIKEGLKGIGSFFVDTLLFLIGNPVISIPLLLAIGASLYDSAAMGEQNKKTASQAQSNVASFESQYGDTQTFINTYGMDEYIKKMNEVAAANEKLSSNFDDCLNHIETSSTNAWSTINTGLGTSLGQMQTTVGTSLGTIASNTATSVAGIVTGVGTKMSELKSNNSSTLNQVASDTNSNWATIASYANTGAAKMASNVNTNMSTLRSDHLQKMRDVVSNTSTQLGEAETKGTSKMKNLKDNVTSHMSGMAKNADGSARSTASSLNDKIAGAVNNVLYQASKLAGSMNVYLGKPSVQLPNITVSGAAKGAGLLGSVIVPNWNISWSWWAQGGFPDSQIFMANEAGNPEMVGKIGNRPAVANNDQIVAAVSRGVAEAVSAVMGTNNGPTVISVDGKELFNIIVNRNNEQVAMTGESPLLV